MLVKEMIGLHAPRGGDASIYWGPMFGVPARRR